MSLDFLDNRSLPYLRNLTEDEVQYLVRRKDETESKMARIVTHFCMINVLASIPLAIVSARFETRNIVFCTVMTFFCMFLLWLHKSGRTKLFIRLAMVALMASFAGQSFQTWVGFHQANLDYRWFSLSLLYGGIFTNTLAFPRVRLPVWFTIYIVTASIIASLPAPRFAMVSTGIICVLIVTMFLRLLITRVIQRQIVAAFRLRRYELAAERERIETELELARKIHESFGAPPETKVPGNMIIQSFQSRHSEVGGDWAMIRKLNENRTIVLVADSTGKGIQAALVIHALQSLWARSLQTDDFEPRAFLDEVNGAMVRLGRKEPHSLTVGLLDIYPDRVVYWSAGHIPLFILQEDEELEHDRVKALVSKGNPLGLMQDIAIRPAEYKIPDNRFCLLLGTDGIFDKGTRFNRRDARQLLDRVRKHGKKSLDLYDVADDKTLIWIKPDREDRRKTPRAS